MSIPLRVLIVEDSEADTLLLLRQLTLSGFEPTHTRVQTADTFRESLEETSWDIIIADYLMPKFTGMTAFGILQDTGLDIPFVIVSGSIGEEIAVSAMKAGVQDYVMKGNLARLVPAVQRELRDAAERRARRTAEEEARKAERLRMVGELTTSLIHDLKNPLLVVQLATDLLRKPNLGTADHDKYCNVIEQQIRRITGMSQEIMEFVRGDSNLTVQETDLAALVKDLVNTYAEPFANDGIELSFEIRNPNAIDLNIPVDADKLVRALLNLISNARDAVTTGGRIKVVLESQDDEVRLTISDTGTGIPEEIRETLFEPFVTHGKSCGTGLGLAIVKRIIDAHGGAISVESELSVGTTFHISLPRRSPTLAARADKARAHALMA